MNDLYLMGEFVYSDTDSILVPTQKVPLCQHRIGDALGELKVEASGDNVIIIGHKTYYLTEAWWRACGTPHAKIAATGNIRRWYGARLN
jgi:hypothetical protein